MKEVIENNPDIFEIWAKLASEGKAPSELNFASQVLPVYTVGIEPWVERLSKTYLQRLCRRHAHFKMVIAPYGGGKTHFLMSVGTRALKDGYAVSYIPCSQGIDLNSSLQIYTEFIKGIQLPGQSRPGLKSLLQQVIDNKTQQIQEAGAPDVDVAFSHWLSQLSGDEYRENAFGRIMADALRFKKDPSQALANDASLRWLRGEINTLNKEELTALNLTKYPTKAHNELGRNLIISICKFIKEAGVHGAVILLDEAETMFTATGKALLRVLSAMRVLLDLPGGITGGVPMFCIFSATPEVLEDMPRYGALDTRMKVLGVSFEEGNDFAAQINLSKIQYKSEKEFLAEIGIRLIELGKLATGHDFNRKIQINNLNTLTDIALSRNLDINARRLFVKTWVNILDHQTYDQEKAYTEEELTSRYQGNFNMIVERQQEVDEP